MLKPLKSRKDCKAYSAEVEALRIQAQRKLFDIVACKCKLPSNCSCSKERIIPKEEHEFILDQSSELAIIGGWDWKNSWKMTAKFLRKQREEDLFLHSDCSDKVTSNAELELSSEGESTTGKVDEDETYAAAGPSSYKRLHEKMDNCSQMKKKIKHLPTLANACDHFGVSDRAATLFVSSLLQDIKAVSSQDTSEVADRNKIRRVRQKKRSSLKNKESSTTRGIYFGGQKDLTIKEEK